MARSGETVSKDELMHAVWPDSWVEESNLTQNIFLLRKALGESAQDSSYIITIPGRGYRLAAEVRQVDNGDNRPAAVAANEMPAPPELLPVAAAERSGRLRWLWLLAPGLVLIAVVAGLAWHRHNKLVRRPLPRA